MPTSTYWAKRILADEKRAQALTSRAARKTQQAYRASYKRVLREMEGLSAQAQSGGAVTRTQLWRYSHWRGMTEELRKFASSGAALEEQRLTKVLDQVFSNVIGADVKAFGQKQWRTRLNASSVVNTAWSGENYSTRIWRNRALLASRVREEVTQAVLDGKPVNRIAADLQSAFSSSWSQAERLARTETSYVFNQASLRRYAELGIRQVRWITGINDGRECEVCAERSGQVYDLNNAPMMPAHPNCRCAWGAVVEGEEDIIGTTVEGLTNLPYDGIMEFDSDQIWYPITPESIRSVPQFTEFPTPEVNMAVHKACVEILTDLADLEVGTEESITFRLSDMSETKVRGELGDGRVRLMDFDSPYITIHNHPSNGTLSYGDIEVLGTHVNCMGIVAIGNNGKNTYSLIKGEKYDDYGFAWHRAMCVTGLSTFESEEAFLRGAEAYGVHYTARLH